MATSKRVTKAAQLKDSVSKILENAKKKIEKSKGAEHLFEQKKEIENQYKGKIAEEIWDMWTVEQREHFLKDHTNKHPEQLKFKDYKYSDLYDWIKNRLDEHVHEGEYEKGGEIKDYVVVAEKTYDNGVSYWTIISKPTTKEKAEIIKSESFVIDGEVAKVVTSKEAKEHKHVVGREYLEKGGEMYAKGGELVINETRLKVPFRKQIGIYKGTDGDFVKIYYPELGFEEMVNYRLEDIKVVDEHEHGGELHHNLNVFGYETKHFTEKAHNEFKEAIAKIEEQHLHAHFENKKEALRKCAFYLDKIFAGDSKKDLVYDIEMFAINNYRSDLHISLDIADSHLKEFKEYKEGGSLYKSGRVKEIEVGQIFYLPNGEKIEIERLFIDNIDEDWVEYKRNGKSNENSVKQLKGFLNNFGAKLVNEGMYEHGGELDNKELVANKATEIAHHAKELQETLEGSEDVPAWVVAKIERSATDIADVAHYLEGEEKEFGKGGKTVYKDEKYYGMTVDELERAADARERYAYDGADPAQKQSYLDSAKHHRELAIELIKEQSDKKAKGDQTFASKTKAVEQRLEGEYVPSEYQGAYGKKYSPKEAREAAQRIIGAQVAKSKMGKGGEMLDNIRHKDGFYYIEISNIKQASSLKTKKAIKYLLEKKNMRKNSDNILWEMSENSPEPSNRKNLFKKISDAFYKTKLDEIFNYDKLSKLK